MVSNGGVSAVIAHGMHGWKRTRSKGVTAGSVVSYSIDSNWNRCSAYLCELGHMR